jgi:two-component system CheB/CheR fusion protein
VIRRQVAQLGRLVDDLLDVTRIARGKIRIAPRKTDARELVRRVVEDHRSLFDARGVRLGESTPEGPVWIEADASRIAQAVGNLLQNAAKFTPRGGAATIALERDEGAGRARITVSDSGVGMNEETMAGLFLPFAQGETTLDRSAGGLGLGLSLVKGLVDLHGGEVSAASDGPGRGARFTLHLPLAGGGAAEASPARPSAPAPPRRVLVIEDNLDAAESLREVLELDGHEVRVAGAGPEGIALAEELTPEVILCDIGLPGMDGYEVARALRALPRLRGTLLVALSGYALPDNLRRAAEAGFHEHLAKPPDLERLADLLRR